MKSFVTRLLMYPICLAMIYLGIGMIFNFQNWDSSFISGKQLFAGIGMIAIALVYMITDILIMIQKKKD